MHYLSREVWKKNLKNKEKFDAGGRNEERGDDKLLFFKGLYIGWVAFDSCGISQQLN